MEQIKITSENLFEVLDKVNIKCRKRDVIISLNSSEIKDDKLNLSTTELDIEQFVLGVGPHVTDLIVGDRVILDLDKLSTRRTNPRNSEEVITVLNIDPISITEDILLAVVDSDVIKYIKL